MTNLKFTTMRNRAGKKTQVNEPRWTQEVGAWQMAIGPQSKSAQMTHQISVQGAGDKRPSQGLEEPA